VQPGQESNTGTTRREINVVFSFWPNGQRNTQNLPRRSVAPEKCACRKQARSRAFGGTQTARLVVTIFPLPMPETIANWAAQVRAIRARSPAPSPPSKIPRGTPRICCANPSRSRPRLSDRHHRRARLDKSGLKTRAASRTFIGRNPTSRMVQDGGGA
jgi:hypothetical protein